MAAFHVPHHDAVNLIERLIRSAFFIFNLPGHLSHSSALNISGETGLTCGMCIQPCLCPDFGAEAGFITSSYNESKVSLHKNGRVR